MSNKSDSILGNDTICDAFECYGKATENIRIRAGYFGIITLRVCKKCSKLFVDSEENKLWSKKSTFNKNTI